MNKILIVEDNTAISKGLKYSLEQEQFVVTIAPTGLLAEQYINNNKYDLIILDITLPDTTGYEICNYIKEVNDTKIIFLTAKESEEDVVHAFDLGADDYIIKPFRLKELISRINNVLRRKQEENMIKNNNLIIDLDSRRVYQNDKEIIFTTLEFNILSLLYANLNKIVTREQLLSKIWDSSDNYVEDNTLTVYIKRIREKLNDDSIKTIKGIGYRVDKE